MSLLGFEGFDENNTGFSDQTLNTGQGATGSGSAGAMYWQLAGGSSFKNAGQFGGSAMQLTTTATAYCLFGANYSRLITGIRFRTHATNVATSDVFWYGDGTHQQIGLSINASKIFIIWGNTGSNILATGTTVLTGATWYYLELDVTFHSSAGAVTLRLNGSGTEASASGVNTASSGANQANRWGFTLVTTNGLQGWFDDMYLVDPTTGSAPFTSMLGPCRVETLFPTANSSVAWTPNASSNVSRVQETGMDSDATYNSIATAGQDTFTHGALSSTPATIFAAAVRAVMRKDQTTNPTAQTMLMSGGTNQAGAAYSQALAYQAMRDIYLNDPNTGLPWTATGINNTVIGYNRVTL